MSQEMEHKEEQITLEQQFEAIEEILAELESADISLEESFTKYQEGMKLLQNCNQMIDGIEKKVLILNENGDLDGGF